MATRHYTVEGAEITPRARTLTAYHTAVRERRSQPEGTLQAILNAYQESQKFQDLAPRTQKDYVRHIRQIEGE
jgi:hypothetical protein